MYTSLGRSLKQYLKYYLLKWSLIKKGYLRASLAVSLSEGSNLSNPCNRCMRSPAEWSTCCIIRFCKYLWRKKCGPISVINNSFCFFCSIVRKLKIKQTCNLGSFITALILSLEVAPSGQSNLPLLTYFSAFRLHIGTTRYTLIIKLNMDQLKVTMVSHTYSTLFNMCCGKGPSTLSIIARCSKFSWVWNNASPCKWN